LKSILVSELSGPLFFAIFFTICYCFVKSLSPTPVNALLRVAIYSLGPIVFNAVVLLATFFISLFMGTMLQSCCGKFGGVMAGFAHMLGVLGMLGMFEFAWYIERQDIANTLIGMLSAMAIQRFILKFLIALFMSREFKHDLANRSWWTGVWTNRGLGSSALTQPFREFIVKLVEMSAFTADFILAHILLFFLSLPCLIPKFDVVHSVSLFCKCSSRELFLYALISIMFSGLRPSRQIRAPIFSYKQRTQRRRIVLKYTVVFYTVFAAFAALIVLPVVFRDDLNAINCSICDSI
jgi:1,3-beta-glucan synthase